MKRLIKNGKPKEKETTKIEDNEKIMEKIEKLLEKKEE